MRARGHVRSVASNSFSGPNPFNSASFGIGRLRAFVRSCPRALLFAQRARFEPRHTPASPP